MAYVCSRYPDCDSFVMAHAKTFEADGQFGGTGTEAATL